jgi:hypothetical protein
MKSPRDIENLFKNLHDTTSAEMDERVLRDVSQALEQTFNAQAEKPSVRRIIMKSKITKFAAAAVIIIAVTIGFNIFVGTGGSVAFADVIQPILDARTVTMDLLIGPEGRQTVIHDEVMGSRIRRTVSGIQSADVVIDFETMKMVVLSHPEKTAVYIGLDGLGDIQNYLELLKDIVVRMQDEEEFQVQNQGLQEIDGHEYIVFVAESDKETITIWVDPETALPVRIEQETPNMQIICNNIQFDVALDESRFSMEVPAGYTIQESSIDFEDSSESGFIETLRIWAEIIEDGQFPDSISLGDVIKIGPKFDKELKRLNLTDQEQLEVAMQWGQGYVFIRFFKGQGQWHYAGKDVKLGDSNTPIFWYRPQDCETYRVIYGDLTVEDVAPEDLPE